MLLWAAIALGLSAVLRRVLAAIGFYRFVWHRALFDLAVTVLLLWGTVALACVLGGTMRAFLARLGRFGVTAIVVVAALAGGMVALDLLHDGALDP